MVAGILDEPFGARFETDALEPWQQRVLVDLRLDGPEADLTVHLGGDSTRGRLPVRYVIRPNGNGSTHCFKLERKPPSLVDRWPEVSQSIGRCSTGPGGPRNCFGRVARHSLGDINVELALFTIYMYACPKQITSNAESHLRYVLDRIRALASLTQLVS